ncbi:hypothetical protein F5148DRAFT_1307148 [Russula earlei]|uniref:Uncharacterized protein n=1 Tax=Russula earlei TaxID=71964 RepID=A0ACC0U8P7_9AGAM|nr:hypothetical protein F5148DRAFT_1307148 [Russula earlei]
MRLAPAHPYAHSLRGQPVSWSTSAVHTLRASSLEEVESRSVSIGSEYDSATAFASVLASPLSKPEASIPETLGIGNGHPYVKHGSGITLILSGHQAGTPLPLYSSGSLMSGMIALAKPTGVASVDVKLEGSISIREIQGGGRSSVCFFSDQLVAWTASGSRLPDDFRFRRIVPSYSHDQRLLPPTFDSRLSSIPGFRVSVKWAVVVTFTRARTNPLFFLRRTSRLSVPIGYIPRTRPPLQGLFPFAPSSPNTSFVDIVPTRREHTPPIHTQVAFFFPRGGKLIIRADMIPPRPNQIYLRSQITPMTEVIPFRIVLSAPDSYLKPFLNGPSPASFLPLGGSPIEDTSSGPVCVQLMRRIGADPRETFVVVVGELATSTERGAVIGEGILSNPEIGQETVSWRGEVRVHLDRAMPGGFITDRLVVQDVLVLTLNAPTVHTHAFPFRQVVPMRLTTDLPGTSGAAVITGV